MTIGTLLFGKHPYVIGRVSPNRYADSHSEASAGLDGAVDHANVRHARVTYNPMLVVVTVMTVSRMDNLALDP